MAIVVHIVRAPEQPGQHREPKVSQVMATGSIRHDSYIYDHKGSYLERKLVSLICNLVELLVEPVIPACSLEYGQSNQV